MIILLNGPSGCGKDTATTVIKRIVSSITDYRMSTPLKRGVRNIYDLTNDQMRLCNESPDDPWDFLYGLSYRSAQIRLFYGLVLAHDGTILAQIAIDHVMTDVVHANVIIDCGKTVEAECLRKAFPGRVGLIRIEREGCSFDGDIREYITGSFTDPATINNQYGLDLYEAQLAKVLRKWGVIEDENM